MSLPRPHVGPGCERPAASAAPRFSGSLASIPLAPLSSAELASERAAFDAAVASWVAGGESPDLEELRAYLDRNPRSPWRLSLLTTFGRLDYRDGRFGRALEEWREVHRLGAALATPEARGVVDEAVSELALLLAKLGRREELTPLLAEAARRALRGPAARRLALAREGLSQMHSDPGGAYRCGPFALAGMLRASASALGNDPRIDALRSSERGTSLAQVAKLASDLGVAATMARRSPGVTIPLPAVVHWKAGHFSALLGETFDDAGRRRYLSEDPTFGERLWITGAALEDEASGYFLLARAELGAGWSAVGADEAARVFGRGATGSRVEKGCGDGCCVPVGGGSGSGGAGSGAGGPGVGGPGASGPGAGLGPGGGGSGPMVGGGPAGGLGGCSACEGMPGYHFNALLVSLRINDTPLHYTPPVGAPIRFSIAYDSKDIHPAGAHSQLGNGWTFSYLGYIVDDTTLLSTPAHDVKLYAPGGGLQHYRDWVEHPPYNFDVEFWSRATLYYDPVLDRYERLLPSGWLEMYEAAEIPDPPGERKVYLSRIIDPWGNEVTLDWVPLPSGAFRLERILDAGGRETILHYEDEDYPLRISKVVDPFEKEATFGYAGEHLVSVADTLLPNAIVTSFAYDDPLYPDFITEMTTPYGTTKFRYMLLAPPIEPPLPDPLPPVLGPIDYLEAEDPDGNIERIEYRTFAEGIAKTEPLEVVPEGIGLLNDYLDTRNSFYWNKKAYAETWGATSPPVTLEEIYAGAHLFHWLKDETGDRSFPLLESEKPQLERRLWYGYEAQNGFPNRIGNKTPKTHIARRLDDGDTQIWRWDYNGFNRLKLFTDPAGRETKFEYDFQDEGVDLQRVRQRVGTSWQELLSIPAWDRHLPVTVTDAAGETTTYNWNGKGQIDWILNPRGEETSFVYIGDFLREIHRPLGWQTLIEYDSSLRPWRVTDPDGDLFELAYDTLDRLRTLTFPDLSTREWSYDRLDVVDYKDRENRHTIMSYDALRRLETLTDPLSRTLSFSYCDCGGLHQLTDDLDHTTTWERDVQGRVTKKIREDGGETSFLYEPATSRLARLTDPKDQQIHFSYAPDDRLLGRTYELELEPTPDVAFTWDPSYPRLATMLDGRGLTTFDYWSIDPPSPGAGRLKSEAGPNPGEVVTFAYDELGRLDTETVGSIALGNVWPRHWVFDELGRVDTLTSSLGAFSVTPDGHSDRVARVDYPNGQWSTYLYHPAPHSRRLLNFTHFSPAPSPPLLWATFAWTDEGELSGLVDSGVGVADVHHDLASQLLRFGSPYMSGEYTYAYDDAGNRESAQRPGEPAVSFDHDEANQLTFADQGLPTERAFLYDDNGNCTSDTPLVGAQTNYRWDAEDRLIEVSKGTQRSLVEYDGLGRRRRITELQGQTVQSDLSYLWCGTRICAELSSGLGVPTKVLYPEGEFYPATGAKRFYVHDHLGSVRVMSNELGLPVSSYKYDPWGAATRLYGTEDPVFGYAGYLAHRPSGLNLTWYRAYDPGIGRWLSRDPIGEAGGVNLYSYVGNSPLTWSDPAGLFGLPANPSGLPPGWVRDTGHLHPHGERYIGPGRHTLDFHRGQAGKPGQRGKDHWHYDDGKEHLKPGHEIPDPPPTPEPNNPCSDSGTTPSHPPSYGPMPSPYPYPFIITPIPLPIFVPWFWPGWAPAMGAAAAGA